jgi:molybdate transport system substrate-binding protein
MRLTSAVFATALALIMSPLVSPQAASAATIAADITVVSGGAFKQVLTALIAQYEKETGNTVAATYQTVGQHLALIRGGKEQFDVAVLTPEAIEGLVKEGKIMAGTRADLAKVGVGVVVKAGAPLPDISTDEAFKRALLAAKSVAYIDPKAGGSSGIYVDGLLQRLGVADQVHAKAVLVQGGAVADHVADGEAEIGVHQISEILPVAGVTLVGPLPADIQNFTIYSAGVGTAAKDAAAAKGFVEFLTGPHALPIIKAKGMQPATS